jgi:hypothetical protein
LLRQRESACGYIVDVETKLRVCTVEVIMFRGNTVKAMRKLKGYTVDVMKSSEVILLLY